MPRTYLPSRVAAQTQDAEGPAAPAGAEAGWEEERAAQQVGGPIIGSLAATLCVQAIQAITVILVARILGPTGRGELTAVILWPMLLTTLGSLGMYQAVTYFAARTRDLSALVGTTLVFLVVDAAVLVAAGLLLLPLVLGDYGSDVVSTGQNFLALYIPFVLVAMTMLSFLNGQHRFRWLQSLRLLLVGLTLVVIGVIAAFGDLTLGRAAAGYLVGTGSVAVIGLIVVLRSVRRRLLVRWATLRDLLAYGLKTLLSVSLWNINERADQLVLSAFFSAATLGLYVVGVTMTAVTTTIGFGFALVALPLVAGAGSIAERREIAHTVVAATLLAGVVITVPLLILEPWLIRTLFGEEFEGAIDVGRILLIAAVFFGLNRVLEAVLQGVGRPLDSSIGEAIALVCTVVGLAVLLPTIGFLGAGITSLIAYLAATAFLVRRASRALEVPALALMVPEPAALRDMLTYARGRLGGNRGAQRR